MSWKEKRLITILSIILAVLCAAVLVVLSIRYRAAQAAKDQNTVSPSDIAEAAQSEYVALSYSNGSTTLSFSLNEDGVWTWDSEPDFPLDDTHVKSILTILETLKPQQTLDMPEDLSVYGLDAPDVSLTATAPDDAVLTLPWGMPPPMEPAITRLSTATRTTFLFWRERCVRPCRRPSTRCAACRCCRN